jgi:hypothetical protein
MKRFQYIEVLATAALLAVAGCHSGSQTAPQLLHGENFVPDDQPHAVDNLTAAQAASGTRADATLYPAHFSDASLNSLGREKLELMLHDEEVNQPLTVYLDLPAGTDPAPARQAVTEYLKARGLAYNQIKLVDGPNPRTIHPSTDALTGLANLQQTQAPGGQAPTAAGQATPQSTSSGASGYGTTGSTDNMNH